jgi:hypothetical protein
LFDWDLYNYQNHQFSPVLGPWVQFADGPLVKITGYGIFTLSIIGVILALKKKQNILISLLPIYIVSLIMLCNGTWPIPKLFDLLGTFAPVAREALRFPFTKFSILFITGLSIFAANAIDSLFKKRTYMVPKSLFVTLIAATLIFSFLPAFEGYLIQPTMRINIPQEYFDMFTWFNTQNRDGRVAILPIHSFWNWTYYTWGYQGAGFLQFGIPQPILDRDYDRWSPDNQQYEQDMSYAVYSQDPTNIRAVLAKYNVSWVMVDTSVFAPTSNENQTLLWLIPKLMNEAGLTETKTFGNNITIYTVPTATPTIVGYTTTPVSYPLNPYFSLVNNDERVTQLFFGTVVAQSTGRSYQSTDVPKTDNINMPALDHNRDYVLEITSKHTSGFPLELCVSNDLTSHCDLYVYLGTQSTFATERFLLPKLEDYGSGYSVDIDNFTIHGMTSINDIQSIRVLTLPIDTSDTIQASETATTQQITEVCPILYRVQITKSTTTLTLRQTYESGWIAWFDGKILPHVLINTWANGWTGNFGTNDIIYIMFWPQLLEWLGFALLPVSIIVAVKHI